MRITVVFLPPQRGRLDVIERGDIPSPLCLGSHFQKFRILLDHGGDDAQEGFVRREDGVPTGPGERRRVGKVSTGRGGKQRDSLDARPR